MADSTYRWSQYKRDNPPSQRPPEVGQQGTLGVGNLGGAESPPTGLQLAIGWRLSNSLLAGP